MRAAIVGLAGPVLAPGEASLLREHPPAGVILFARNIEDPDQLARLMDALRQALPPQSVLMIDQEGGRVARLRPPHWPAHPPAAAFGRLYARDRAAGIRAAWLTGALIGIMCGEAGFDVVAAPVLDLGLPGANTAIGDRAFGSDSRMVARLGRSFAEGLLASGRQPVMKHVPGHGRATVDSHLALPRVETAHLGADLAPFVYNAGLPWAMTAHILYPHWDAERPATLSETIIREIVRGRVGFTGVLVTDDLAMGALAGPPEARATAGLAAGADLALYCAGEGKANEAVLRAVPEITKATAARLARARAMAASERATLDAASLAAERARLLSA
ncbi:MAG TPA: beta-N-acetylhexosaminidase [Acetobacteraceae bacterium]|nr:beta-N-acetylhexosaminidase [Acetobacteraceae bacterium]